MKKILPNPNDFYRSSMFYISCSLIASAVNYLLYPALARLITPSDMGDVGIASAIILQISSLLMAFNLVAISQVQHNSSAEETLGRVQTSLVRLTGLVCVAILLLTPFLQDALKIQHSLTLVCLAVALFVLIPSTTWTGFLQGHKQLPLIGIYNLVNTSGKFAFSVLFAALGFGATGAIAGIAVGFIIGILLIKIVSPLRLPPLATAFKIHRNTSRGRPVLTIMIVPLLATSLTAALYSLDVITAKLLFDQHSAGIYVGAATLASVVYYLILNVTWVIMPHYSPTDAAHNNRVTAKAIFIGLAITAAVTLSLFVMGGPIIQIVFGQAYLPIAHVAWKLALSQGVIGLTTLYTYSRIARQQPRPLLAAIALFASVISSVLVLHPTSFDSLITSVIYGELFGLSFFALILLITRKDARP